MAEVCTEQWIVDRAHLRALYQQHPERTQPHFAQELGRARWLGAKVATPLS